MTAPKKVLLVKKVSRGGLWYADKVGEHVPFLGIWPGEGYKSREPAGYINIVYFPDADIVDAPTEDAE